MRYPPKIKLAAIAAGPLAAAAVVTAGCGSTAAPTGAAGGSPSPTVHGSGVASRHSCQSSAMKVTLDESAGGVAAGSSYVPLQFENTSSSPCTLPSYPQVSFASGSAGPDIGLPAAQAQGQSDTTKTVTLAPGQTAYAWLRIMDAAAFPASACKPVTAQGLRVSFAASTSTAFIAEAMQACQGSPQGGSILAVYPMQSGHAARGTAP
jgi:Protein of unknown function (DUF4232)